MTKFVAVISKTETSVTVIVTVIATVVVIVIMIKPKMMM